MAMLLDFQGFPADSCLLEISIHSAGHPIGPVGCHSTGMSCLSSAWVCDNATVGEILPKHQMGFLPVSSLSSVLTSAKTSQGNVFGQLKGLLHSW